MGNEKLIHNTELKNEQLKDETEIFNSFINVMVQLIANRLCVAVGDPYRYAESVIELDCDGTMFSAKGKTVLQELDCAA